MKDLVTNTLSMLQMRYFKVCNCKILLLTEFRYTIRDVYTMFTVYTVYIFYTVYTVNTALPAYTASTNYTAYTAHTV